MGVAVTPDGGYLVSIGLDGAIKIWDGSTGRCYRTIQAGGEDLTSCAVSSDGKRMLTGGGKGSVRLWSLDADGLRKIFSNLRFVGLILSKKRGTAYFPSKWL